MRVLVWHVHGGWMDAFVRGEHDYIVPLAAGQVPRAQHLGWGENVLEVDEAQLRTIDFDIVVLQRLEELELLRSQAGRQIGIDVPAVFVEHNTPLQDVPESRHPLADRSDVTIAHVTHFNSLMWDCGSTSSAVIEHGVFDRGYNYTGEIVRGAVVINEPVRRWRSTGSDLVGALSADVPVDIFGIDGDRLAPALGLDEGRVAFAGNWSPDELHAELGHRRLYLHPARWTSLGLSLIEAMHAGMPVVALGTTEAHRAIPVEAGVVSTNLQELRDGIRRFASSVSLSRSAGEAARDFALNKFGLRRFLDDWHGLLAAVREGVVLDAHVVETESRH